MSTDDASGSPNLRSAILLSSQANGLKIKLETRMFYFRAQERLTQINAKQASCHVVYYFGFLFQHSLQALEYHRDGISCTHLTSLTFDEVEPKG
jgi:hypothetical protein